MEAVLLQALLQALVQQPEPVHIPAQNLDAVAPAVGKDKQRLGKRVQTKAMRDQSGQAVDVLATS